VNEDEPYRLGLELHKSEAQELISRQGNWRDLDLVYIFLYYRGRRFRVKINGISPTKYKLGRSNRAPYPLIARVPALGASERSSGTDMALTRRIPTLLQRLNSNSGACSAHRSCYEVEACLSWTSQSGGASTGTGWPGTGAFSSNNQHAPYSTVAQCCARQDLSGEAPQAMNSGLIGKLGALGEVLEVHSSNTSDELPNTVLILITNTSPALKFSCRK